MDFLIWKFTAMRVIDAAPIRDLLKAMNPDCRKTGLFYAPMALQGNESSQSGLETGFL
ncbi:MAG: hypothetical protein ACNA7E_07535 [Wenzhouxiangellaceae bacterium]